jgi:outer membrane lipase/esterase
MPMRRMQTIVSMAVVVSSVLLALPLAVSAQGLNDVLIRILNSDGGATNCGELGGTANTRGALFNFCGAVPNPSAGSSAGGTPTVDSQLGGTQEQRRQAERLAERRAGRGGSADQPGSGFGLFVNGDYQFLNKDTTRFETGFEQHTAGTTVGLDYSFRSRAVLGVAVNYAHEFGDFAGATGGYDNDAYGLTLYGTVVPITNLFIDGFIGYSRKQYSIDRRIHIQMNNNNAVAAGLIEGDTHSDEVNVGTNIGYDFALGNFTVGPRVGVNYLDRRLAGYQESGRTGIELIYDNQNISSLTTTAGLFASVAISTRWGVLVPQATAEYVHEFLNDQRSVGFQFVDTLSRPRFLFQTDTPDRNFFNLGVGAVFVLPGGMSTFVNVRELVGYSTRRATNVTAGLRLAF